MISAFIATAFARNDAAAARHWAVIATDDKAFDQKMLQHMAKRIGAKVTEAKASHALYVTQAKVVADVIDQAAKSVAQGNDKEAATR